jgi:ALIX V-shaped domain binding to HIV
MRATIVADVDKVEAQLDAEAKEDEEARQHYGEREWPLQPSSVCTANLRDRIAGYK